MDRKHIARSVGVLGWFLVTAPFGAAIRYDNGSAAWWLFFAGQVLIALAFIALTADE